LRCTAGAGRADGAAIRNDAKGQVQKRLSIVFGEAIVVWNVHDLVRQMNRARRTTGDERHEFGTVRYPPTQIKDEFTQRKSNGRFVDARILHVATDTKETRTTVVPRMQGAQFAEGVPSYGENARHDGDRLDVVDGARTAKSTGAFGCPSTVNNVETIAIMPSVFSVGGDAFSKLSTLHSWNDGGARLFGVSGHVKNPGVYEAAVGLTLRELIFDLGGGISDGAELMAFIPGGSSCPVHLADEVVNVPNDDRFAEYNGKPLLDLPLGVDTYRGAVSTPGARCTPQ